MKTQNSKTFIAITNVPPRQVAVGKDTEDQQSLLVSIINSTNDAIISKTLEGIITTWNPAAKNLFGHTAAEAIGKNISILIPPHCIAEEAAIIEKISNGDHIEQYETQRLRKDGSLVYVSVTISALKDAEGNITGACKIARDISEKKCAEEKLKQSEANLHAIFETADEGFILLDRNGIIKTFNSKAKKSIVFTSNNKTVQPGDSIFDYIEDFRMEDFKKIIARILNGETIQYDKSYTLENGRKHWFHFSYTPVKEENNVTGICITGTDIRRRKAIEEKLEQSEKRFRALVENSGDGVTILSPEGKPHYISPSIARVLGYSEEEAMQLNLFSLVHPDDLPQVEHLWEKILANPGMPITGNVCRILHKSGSWRWFEGTVTNMLHDPAVSGIVDNFRDITEKIEADHKLRLSEERYRDERMLLRTLIDNLPLNVYAKDIQSRKTLANRADCEFMGASNEKEALGKDDSGFFPAEFARKTRMEEQLIFSTGQAIINEEEQHETRDGRKRWFLKSKIPLRNEDDQIVGLVGISYDITDRKKNEIAIAELNKQLNKRAEELIASNTELERFAYVASHDLQEPLRMVSSFLQLLQKKYKERLDDTANQYIEFAVDGAERMKKLILDLLEYSRVGTNKDVLTDINTSEVISQVLETFSGKITETGAIIKTQLMPVIKANRTQITQLFQNLVSNALKYNASAIPEIEIGCEDKDDRWQFFVKDNGIGIEQKFLDKVFIIFQRLHNKNQFSGTGIGLAICKKIVERHGGTIWIESRPGAGSIFFFTIKK